MTLRRRTVFGVPVSCAGIGPVGGNSYRAHKVRSPGISLFLGRAAAQPTSRVL